MKKQNSTSPTAQRVCAHHRPNRTGVRILRGMQRNVLNKSIDEAGAYFPNIKMSLDSQNSVGKESHELLSNDTIFNKRDRTKRSDTAKRHVLARQKPIDNAESHSANSKPHSTSNRRFVPIVRFMIYIQSKQYIYTYQQFNEFGTLKHFPKDWNKIV